MGRVLLVSPVAPYPVDTGASQRTFLLFQALRQRHEVDLVLINNDVLPADVQQVLASQFNMVAHMPADDGDYAPRSWRFNISLIGTPLRRLTRAWLASRITLFRSPRMSQQLAQLVQQRGYAAIVSRYLATACQVDAFAQLPVFVDVDDLPSEVWFSRLAAARNAGALTARCTHHIALDYQAQERVVLKRAAGVWVAKAKDLQQLDEGTAAGLLPNVPFASYPDGVRPLPAPTGTTPALMGVALFDWPPNKAGFDWFVKKVWPLVHRARPDARLDLVGKLSDAPLQQSWQATPGVRCLGRVQDLRAAYEACTAAVAPIFTGGGTNIKVVEALSYGRCCVVTPHAGKGFEQLYGLHTADNAQAFAQACLQLLADPSQAVSEGLKASDVASREFSFAGFARAVHAVMDHGPVPSWSANKPC